MQKHLLRLFIIYTGFQLFRKMGAELPELFRGHAIFRWIHNSDYLLLILTDYLLFLLYPISAFLLYNRFYKQSRKTTLLYSLLTVLSIITFRYIVEEITYPALFGFHNYYEGVPILYYYVDNFYYAIIYWAFGAIYFLLYNENRLQQEHTQLALAHKQSQLSFLQSQVNPHFLFNSLNNIYALVYRQSPKALAAVAQLSELMRYMLYDSSQLVPVQKEVDYIQKYIALQSLRFETPPTVEQTIKGPMDKVRIPPLLLIPFIENAFKHGQFKTTNQPLLLTLEVTEKILHFTLVNAIGQQEKDAQGGIGLQNTRERLSLLYPNKHSLSLKTEGDCFVVELSIQHA